MTLHSMVTQLENKSRKERLEELLKSLKERQLTYDLQTFTYKLKEEDEDVTKKGTNVIIQINPLKSKKIVVGAHYDPKDGAGAANDNGSGVSVLIALIEHFIQLETSYSLDFVFFDLEEYNMHGSIHYLSTVDKNSILGMINLDMCGTGDTIIFDHKNDDDNFLSHACRKICIEHAIPFRSLQRIPPGDDLQFEKERIPAISIGIIPKSAITFVDRLAKAIHPKWSISRANSNFYWRRWISIILILPYLFKMPDFIKVMHKPTDTSEHVSEEALQMVYRVSKHLISDLQKIAKIGKKVIK